MNLPAGDEQTECSLLGACLGEVATGHVAQASSRGR
jgi:hypothetical protein